MILCHDYQHPRQNVSEILDKIFNLAHCCNDTVYEAGRMINSNGIKTGLCFTSHNSI